MQSIHSCCSSCSCSKLECNQYIPVAVPVPVPSWHAINTFMLPILFRCSCSCSKLTCNQYIHVAVPVRNFKWLSLKPSIYETFIFGFIILMISTRYLHIYLMLLFLHINFLVEVGEGRRQLNTTHFFVDVFQEVPDGNLRPKIKHHNKVLVV